MVLFCGYCPFDLLTTQVAPFELGWSLLSAEYGANVKKRATLVRGPKTTQQYKSLYWAELGLGALGPGQKAFNSITQIGVLSSLVLPGFDPQWPNLIFACEATFSSPIR